MAVVARGLPVRPRLRRLPSQVAARRPAVGDRRRPLRPGRGRGACARARARVRGRGSRGGWRRFAAERGRRGLLVFAIDTELLGHWWWEGPAWLAEVIAAAEEHGIELVTLAQAAERHPGRGAAAAALDLGRGQGPAHLGLARGRRHGLGGAPARAAGAARGGRRAARGGRRAGRARAARPAGERLGVPRPPRPGRRLPVAAQHRPRPRPARGHKLRPPTRPKRGCATWRPT